MTLVRSSYADNETCNESRIAN